jgi:hypothetical protein
MDTPKTLDACSGSAVGLADKINQAAQSGDRGAQTWLKAGTAIEALAAAQAQAKAEIDVAKASLNAGTISLEQYNTQILETKAGLALFEDEHRKAQIALREHIASTNAATGATGAQKAGLMQLTQQLGDMSTMYSLGMRPQQIFASQVGQVAGRATAGWRRQWLCSFSGRPVGAGRHRRRDDFRAANCQPAQHRRCDNQGIASQPDLGGKAGCHQAQHHRGDRRAARL